jgi:hypothetical protein
MKSKGVTVPIIVAVIGLCGVLGAAIIENWNEFFPSKTPEATEALPTQPETRQSTEVMQHVVPKESVYELDYNHSYPRFAGGANRGGGSDSIFCPSGYIATGLQGNKGDYITGLGLYCSPLNSDGTTGATSKTEVKGNNGGPYWDGLVCPPDKALTAINGVAGGYVDRIQGICTYVAYVDDTGSFETGWAGEGGEVNFESPCDSDDYVTGLSIKWGDYIDGLTMICTPVLKQ